MPRSGVTDTSVNEIKSLQRDFERSQRSARRSPRTIGTYREAIDQLAAFLERPGMPLSVAALRREHVEAFMHNIDDDGNIVGLVRHARPGVDPQVGKVYRVGDGEQTPLPATVIERTREGLVILRAEDDAPSVRVIAGHAGGTGPSPT